MRVSAFTTPLLDESSPGPNGPGAHGARALAGLVVGHEVALRLELHAPVADSIVPTSALSNCTSITFWPSSTVPDSPMNEFPAFGTTRCL